MAELWSVCVTHVVSQKAELFGPNMESQFILQKALKQSELICSSADAGRFLLQHTDNEEEFRTFQGYNFILPAA